MASRRASSPVRSSSERGWLLRATLWPSDPALVVNTTGGVDSAIQGIPGLSSVVKIGNDRVRQTVSSVNKVGQAILNGVDTLSDASLSLASKATQIGAGVVSNSAKIGAAVSQATVALGTSVIQTGVDNAFTLGKNIAQQVSSGHFNVSALGQNMTVGSKWIINDNSKMALTDLLPVLNSTFSSSSRANA
ncbi:hypothetical protein GE061_019308 [Apolygus lucorum]|uniref:Uncharacterized protein n=1 Tax=Apolygus lucorum TaxID=248454 RepID=A0A8S9XA03_APOLU|nr:hypothetical protein GE061_019308 [Apolygus lucorum]